jgi:LysR family transcriptional regulator, nod-box dependent transcriptional activator
MNLRGLDLNLLVILDALLTEQNVTYAGKRIHLSQSATSGALARLREFFGDELLIQVGRKMVLTPLAQSLAVPVREVLLQIQGTIAAKAEFAPSASDRTFRVMGSDYMLTILIPEVLRYLERHAPNITLDLRLTGTAYLEQLERGEIDLLIMPEFFASAVHPKEEFFEDNFICAVWKENPLVGDSITFEQYLALGHVVVKLGREQVPSFEEWFLKQYGYVRRIEAVTPLFTLVPGFLVGTHKIATLHTKLAQFYNTLFPIRLIPFPAEIPKLVEVLQWNKYQDQDPGLIWFRGIIKAVAGKLAADSPT